MAAVKNINTSGRIHHPSILYSHIRFLCNARNCNQNVLAWPRAMTGSSCSPGAVGYIYDGKMGCCSQIAKHCKPITPIWPRTQRSKYTARYPQWLCSTQSLVRTKVHSKDASRAITAGYAAVGSQHPPTKRFMSHPKLASG